MNREILLEATIAITVGLLITVLAAYRSSKEPSKGVLHRAAVIGLLIYAVIAVGLLVQDGMTLIGLIVLLALLVIPLLTSQRSPGVTTGRQRLLVAAVGVGLGAAMLIGAGQTLALLGRVDPRMVAVVIAAIGVLLLAGQGLAAAGRVGSTTVWLLIIPIVLSLALGLFLGAAGQAFSPIVEVPGLDWLQVIGLAVAFAALGWADGTLGALRQAGSWTVPRTWLSAVALVALIALGQLMFLGGAVIAPSLQFFVFPANIDAVPGLAGVLLAILTVVFTALVTIALAGIGSDTPPATSKWVFIGGALAALIALADPGLDTVVVVTSLLAAALLGAQSGGASDRGVVGGLIAAVVATGVLLVTGQDGFGLASAIAAVVVAGVAFAVSRGQDSAQSGRSDDAADAVAQ